MELPDEASVAVIGGGPAGAFFSHFFLGLCDRVGLRAQLDLHEPRDFSGRSPKNCNRCGGVVSESLVQLVATEGINLPPPVIQRGLDSYVLHMDVGSVRIRAPADEKRIAAMFRGSGPPGGGSEPTSSFDGFLLGLARDSGARIVRDRVTRIESRGDRPVLFTSGGGEKSYDLVVGAVGVNSPSLKLFESLGFGFEVPEVTRTYICEYRLGREVVREFFGDSMHVFLLDVPRLKFGAIIPKAECVTLCLLGEKIDKDLVRAFLESPAVRRCFPPGVDLAGDCACSCYPKINVRQAVRPFADRVVLIGDCAATRLYKDGIGAAYKTAKAAATTAVLQGVAAADFKEHYAPACRAIVKDNRVGKLVFAFTRLIQSKVVARRGILRMVKREQQGGSGDRPMSEILWDTFTGSAPYADILRRGMSPACMAALARDSAAGFFLHRKPRRTGATT